MQSSKTSSFMQSLSRLSGARVHQGAPSSSGDQAGCAELAIRHVLVPLDGSPVGKGAVGSTQSVRVVDTAGSCASETLSS